MGSSLLQSSNANAIVKNSNAKAECDCEAANAIVKNSKAKADSQDELGAAMHVVLLQPTLFGRFSLNGHAKHWENHHFFKFPNQTCPKVPSYSNTPGEQVAVRVLPGAEETILRLECNYK